MSVYPRYTLIKGAQELIQHVSMCVPDLIGVGFFGEGKTRIPGEKPLGARRQ